MAEFSEAERAQLAQLVDEAAIRSVVTRYTSALDWMNWPLMETLFWPDAAIDFGDIFRGDTAAFLPFVAKLEEGYTRRMHMFGATRIALHGDSAEAEAPSVTHVRTVDGQARSDDFIWGRYLLGFERRQGEWRMSRFHYMLNAFQHYESREGDEGPMNLADHTSMAHPHAPRF